MPILRSILALLLIGLPLYSHAGVMPADLPAGTVWYLHADLKQMRTTESSGNLYRWLDGEVIVEINEHIDIDLNKEVDRITAFSDSTNGTVVLVEGPLSRDSQQKLLRLANDDATVAELSHKGLTYYRSSDSEHGARHKRQDHEPLADLQDGGYFSFAIPNKLIVAASENQMKELLDNKGRVAGSLMNPGALFVLTADKSFVQAGLKPDQLDHDDDDGWQSNIIRNTEAAAMMISDYQGNIAVELRLISTDAQIARSVGGIVNGLIGLQMFNSELDPKISSLIANTNVDIDDKVLSINTVIAPELVASMLED